MKKYLKFLKSHSKKILGGSITVVLLLPIIIGTITGTFSNFFTDVVETTLPEKEPSFVENGVCKVSLYKYLACKVNDENDQILAVRGGDNNPNRIMFAFVNDDQNDIIVNNINVEILSYEKYNKLSEFESSSKGGFERMITYSVRLTNELKEFPAYLIDKFDVSPKGEELGMTEEEKENWYIKIGSKKTEVFNIKFQEDIEGIYEIRIVAYCTYKNKEYTVYSDKYRFVVVKNEHLPESMRK